MNTTYFLNCTAGNIFGTKKTPALPDKYYVGLSTTTPNKNGTGTTEPSSSAGYQRVELSSLSQPVDGEVKNTSPIEFPESTASWGKVTHYVIYDSPTGGNLCKAGALPEARTIDANSSMLIKTGFLRLFVTDVVAG